MKLLKKQFEIYYADKKTAFSEVLRSAGNFTASKQSLERYQKCPLRCRYSSFVL